MPTGVEVVGSSGNFQITESYKNHSFHQRIDFAAGAARVSFTTSAVRPIIAFRGDRTCIVACSISGANRTYTLQRFNGGALSVYVFGETPNVQASNTGVQVFNASGQLVFDSGYKYMRIFGSVQLPGPIPISTNVGVTVPRYLDVANGGKTLAVFTPYQRGGRFGVSEESGGGFGGSLYLLADCVGIQGAKVEQGAMVVRQEQGATDEYGYNEVNTPPVVFLVDVTGY